MRVIVTGNIGSGKTSFAKALHAELAPLGFKLACSDDIERASEDESYKTRALDLFGTLERSEIARMGFAAPHKLEALERAGWPRWRALLESAMAPERVIVDFPLAIESQTAWPRADLALGVSARQDIRLARAATRLGWDVQHAALANERQLGERAKMAFCDIEIPNEGTLASLEAQARSIGRQIKALLELEPEMAPQVGAQAWRAIGRAYLAPSRLYHGATHLSSVFSALEWIDPAWRRDLSCVLATLYHDYVYDTGAGYGFNEERSSRVLSAHARDLFPSIFTTPDLLSNSFFSPAALAGAMICSTHGHQISDPWILRSPERLARAQAFLDADLSVLGTGSDHDFWAYDDAIGHEFAHMDPRAYHEARAQAMSALSAPGRGPLYLSVRAQAWEPAARERIAQLVDKHLQMALDCPAKELNL